MAKQLDPRMIGTDLPLVVNTVATNTLSAVNSVLTNVTAVNTQITSLTSTDLLVTNNVTTNFLVSTITNNYVFSDLDNSKTYHFNTTVTPSITAVFPESISNGFNVSIINAGIGAVFIQGEGTGVNAPGLVNTIANTGFMIYKYDNQLFGIGVFE